jgi:hypothetical protein
MTSNPYTEPAFERVQVRKIIPLEFDAFAVGGRFELEPHNPDAPLLEDAFYAVPTGALPSGAGTFRVTRCENGALRDPSGAVMPSDGAQRVLAIYPAARTQGH